MHALQSSFRMVNQKVSDRTSSILRPLCWLRSRILLCFEGGSNVRDRAGPMLAMRVHEADCFVCCFLGVILILFWVMSGGGSERYHLAYSPHGNHFGYLASSCTRTSSKSSSPHPLHFTSPLPTFFFIAINHRS